MPKSEKGNDGFIIASGQSSALLHAAEKAFNLVSVAVIFCVERDRFQAVRPVRNDDGNALFSAVDLVALLS